MLRLQGLQLSNCDNRQDCDVLEFFPIFLELFHIESLISRTFRSARRIRRRDRLVVYVVVTDTVSVVAAVFDIVAVADAVFIDVIFRSDQ